MEFLKKFYIDFLCSAIEHKEGITFEHTLENLFAHMNVLVIGNTSEEAAITEPKSWLPANYKRMLLFILYGNTVYIENTYNWNDEATVCYGKSVIRSTENGNIIATATATSLLEDVQPIANMTPTKRRTLVEGYACGSAETRALYRIGIGMQFANDVYGEFAKYAPPGANEENQTLSADSPTAKEAIKQMEALMNEEAESSSPTPAADPEEQDLSICHFGPHKGKALQELPIKVIAWMLASMETGQNLDGFIPSSAYIAKVKEMVETNETATKLYQSFMKSSNRKAS